MSEGAASGNITDVLSGVKRVKEMRVEPDNHHYIALSHLYRWMRERALPVANGVMLDYGCGGQPYREFFGGKITRYIGADVAAAKDTTLDIQFQPNRPLPLADGSVDTVLANQTLEHVSDPDFYLGECNRLLKAGGVLILTAPMQWRHHESPYDFWRFTRFGITELLSRHGFVVKELAPTGGVYALIGQIFCNHLNERRMYSKFIYRQVNRLALWLDRKFPDSEETVNWMCIAVKAS